MLRAPVPERYRVSLIAAVLRWLSYTGKRAILVVSRDGLVLWVRSSEPAWRTSAFFKTSVAGPIEVPATALPSRLGASKTKDGPLSIIREAAASGSLREKW